MRQLVLIALKLTVSAALLYFAISRLNLASLGDRLNHMELGWVAAALALALLQTGVSAVRWREVALACGAALAPRQALRFNLIASFFNQGLPSTVGGDAARIWLLARTGAGQQHPFGGTVPKQVPDAGAVRTARGLDRLPRRHVRYRFGW